MNNIIEIKACSENVIKNILKKAQYFERSRTSNYLRYNNINPSIILMFLEPSTRTKLSFEMSAKILNCHVTSLSYLYSSMTKGESLQDTVDTVVSMKPQLIIIRHCKPFAEIHPLLHNYQEYPDNFKEVFRACSIINAGDGHNQHPTQAIIDLYTIMKKFNLKEKRIKIVFCGDVFRSRVTHSCYELFQRYNIDIHIICPSFLQKDDIFRYNCTIHENLEGLENADIVYILRIQKERFNEEKYEEILSLYQKHLTINKDILDKYCPQAYVMHAGPINRNIEIDLKNINNSEKFLVNEQVSNSIPVRMATIAHCLEE